MAKKFFDSYQQITSFSNLYLAWKKAARGKRSKPPAANFEMQLGDELVRLQDELIRQVWQPGEYTTFRILDPKPRLVSAAPFRDRVVHHALCNIIEPYFDRTFIGTSFANRVGRGTHAALNATQKYIRRYSYVLQCDIKQFFPSIDHEILSDLLLRKIGDKQTLWLCKQIIESGNHILDSEYSMVWFPGDDLFASLRPRGLPIGNLTSQFWANVYLNELDQFVKRRLRCKAYIRYVDDFLLFSDSKNELWKWKNDISFFLQKLRLTMHQRSSTVFPVCQGVPFLGFRLYRDHRRLKRKNGINFVRRLRKYYNEYSRGELTLSQLQTRIRGWIAHVQHGDTWGLRTRIFRTPLPSRNKS